jgi:hypothetical protein
MLIIAACCYYRAFKVVMYLRYDSAVANVMNWQHHQSICNRGSANGLDTVTTSGTLPTE